jgi:hypothetical protein
MRKNNLYLEKLIRRAIMEQDEIPAPPVGASGDDVPPPPTQSTVTYNIIGADGKTDPTKYTVDQLKGKNLTADSYVYNKTLGAWKQIKDVPELNSVIAAGGNGNKSAAPVSDNATMDQPIEGSQKSFMEYCPNAKRLRDTTLNAYNKQMESELGSVADVEEVNTLYDKYTGYQGQFDKDKFLKPCMDELKVTLKGQPELIQKFQSAFSQWMAKDGKELAKKALSAGGNVLLNLANKTLKAKGLGGLTENIIKKNTKNHLIEIYNKKNRRRY